MLKFGIKDSDANLDTLLHCLENSEPLYLEKADDFPGEMTLPQGKSLELIVRSIVTLRQLTARYVDEVALSNLKVNIEKLRLEPDIVYSKFINNKEQTPCDIGETVRECQFREKVSKKVKEREVYYRQQKTRLSTQPSTIFYKKKKGTDGNPIVSRHIHSFYT